MKVTILLLSIDRHYELTKYIDRALKNAGIKYQLAVSDNGSKDTKVKEWIESKKPVVFFDNGYNYGTAQSLNRMIQATADSDYWVFIGNDIEMPNDWLKSLVETMERIPTSGVVGIDWRHLTYEEKQINNVKVWDTTNVFGTMCISKECRNKVGAFTEDYGVYGLWDSDFSLRCKVAGLDIYYIKDLRSKHEGSDVGEQTEYRKMKDDSLKAAAPIFNINRELYKQGFYYRDIESKSLYTT